MKYQGNHMWRLQMNNTVPEVQKGLRPRLANGRLGRSKLVAIFKRTHEDKTFDIRFIKINSLKFKKIIKSSLKFGTQGQTSARKYGWY